MEVKLQRSERTQNGPRPRMNFAGLGRAIRYLGHYKGLAGRAYLFLFIATGAMLMVPQMVQNIIDSVTNGYIAHQLSLIPAALQTTVLPQAFPELSDREREILDLIAQHHSNMEIAERLVVSQSTIKTHVSSILAKLGVASRTEAVALAMRHRLIA